MSIPLAQFGSRVFYNRDLLRKLTGLEEPPDEYRAFLKVCETIRSQTNEFGKHRVAGYSRKNLLLTRIG